MIEVVFITIIFGLIFVLLLLGGAYYSLRDKFRTYREKILAEAAEVLKKGEARMRADAIKRSKYVVTGKVAEQLVPFTDAFGYDPRDSRFFGAPIDLIVFDGMSEGALDKIIFLEVKTGLSRENKRQRQIRAIVEEGEVYYEVLRI